MSDSNINIDVFNPHNLDNLANEIKAENQEYTQNLRDITSAPEFNLLNPDALQAIYELSKYALANGELDFYRQALFDPHIPNLEEIDLFRQLHKKIHKVQAVEAAEFIIKNQPAVTSLDPGMYSGKSTFGHEITMHLEKQGFKSFRIVPSVMNEPHIDIRGVASVDGSHPNHKIEARGISAVNWMEVIWEIVNDSSENKIVHFDEYTFTSPEIALGVVNMLLEKNTSVILAGLKDDYLVRELPAHKILEEINPSRIQYIECRSFVSEFDLETRQPSGTLTGRFLKLSNGAIIPDMGVGEVLIPKEVPGVIYLPRNYSIHSLILLQKHNPELANKILNPDTNAREYQRRFTDALKSKAVTEA